MRRWPTLVVLALAIAALVFAERSRSDEAALADAVPTATALPVAASSGDAGSTWYCAGAATTPNATNDHVVLISNAGNQTAVGELTLYPANVTVDGEAIRYERAAQPIAIEANTQQEISLAPLVASLHPDLAINTGSFVGAVVEVDSPNVTVHHAVRTPVGHDAGPCATTASSQWWFATGTTTADVGYQLHLLNPFSDEAVVDVTFVTDEGVREPSSFQGRLVPPQTLVVLDVGSSVSVFDQVATEVTARTGRVVAERVQVFRNEEGPAGVSMSLGASRLSDQWFFSGGRSTAGASESYVIFNPGDDVASIEVEARPDVAESAADTAPIGLELGPNERWIVTIDNDVTHPVGTIGWVDASGMVRPTDRYFVSVRSFNGVPVVAERILTLPLQTGIGVSATIGATQSATDQTVALGPSDGRRSGAITILNPDGESIAQVQIVVAAPDGERVREEVELGPRRRAVFSYETLGILEEPWVRVVSSRGVIVEAVEITNGGVSLVAAVPVAGTTQIPELLSFG